MSETFQEIAKRQNPAEVFEILLAAEYAQPGERAGYIRALRNLCAKVPKQRDDGMMIEISAIPHEPDSGKTGVWYDVGGYCPGGKMNGDQPGGEHWSLSFTPWAEWAAMPVKLNNCDLSEAQIVAWVLWEMTFFGDEEGAQEKLTEIKDAMADAKAKLKGES